MQTLQWERGQVLRPVQTMPRQRMAFSKALLPGLNGAALRIAFDSARDAHVDRGRPINNRDM